MTQLTRTDIVQDLRRLLVGGLTEQQFRVRYQVTSCPPGMASAWHGIEHWLADADIRACDPEYRRMQEAEMERLIELVASGAPQSELKRASFWRVASLNESGAGEQQDAATSDGSIGGSPLILVFGRPMARERRWFGTPS